MKCTICQKLGHTRKWCRNIELCRECGNQIPHAECMRTFCVNCQTETHTSYDSECPTYIKHKSFNYLRIKRKCTTREAWQIYNNPLLHSLPAKKGYKPQTYAQITTTMQNTNNTCYF